MFFKLRERFYKKDRLYLQKTNGIQGAEGLICESNLFHVEAWIYELHYIHPTILHHWYTLQNAWSLKKPLRPPVPMVMFKRGRNTRDRAVRACQPCKVSKTELMTKLPQGNSQCGVFVRLSIPLKSVLQNIEKFLQWNTRSHLIFQSHTGDRGNVGIPRNIRVQHFKLFISNFFFQEAFIMIFQ